MDGTWRRANSGHGVARVTNWILTVTLFVVVGTLVFSVPALALHLISGGDTSPGGVVTDGLLFFAMAFTVVLIGIGVGRWVYWFADRWIRKG
jgi:hypothetical protein